jgi:hypothetical protein
MAQHSLPDREPVTDEEQQMIAEFCDWLEKPESGMRVYYTGDLATDAFFHNFPEAVRSLKKAASGCFSAASNSRSSNML